MRNRNWAVVLGIVLFSVYMFGCDDGPQKDAEGDLPGTSYYNPVTGQVDWISNPNYDPGPRIPPPASLEASLYDQYPDSNQTELMKSVKAEDTRRIQYLLECGENPNVNVYADLTVLDFALSIDRPDIVEILISSGAQ